MLMGTRKPRYYHPDFPSACVTYTRYVDLPSGDRVILDGRIFTPARKERSRRVQPRVISAAEQAAKRDMLLMAAMGSNHEGDV
jgi:hypothetical protein